MERTCREHAQTLIATILPFHIARKPFRPTAAWREHGENRNTRLQQQSYRFTHKQSFFRKPVATEGRKRLRLGFTAIVRSKPWEKPAKIRARRKKHCRSPWTKIKRRTRTHLGVHGKPGLSLPLSNASLEPRLFHRSGKPHQKRKNAFTPSSPRTAAFRYDAPATPATAGSWLAGCLCWL